MEAEPHPEQHPVPHREDAEPAGRGGPARLVVRLGKRAKVAVVA